MIVKALQGQVVSRRLAGVNCIFESAAANKFLILSHTKWNCIRTFRYVVHHTESVGFRFLHLTQKVGTGKEGNTLSSPLLSVGRFGYPVATLNERHYRVLPAQKCLSSRRKARENLPNLANVIDGH